MRLAIPILLLVSFGCEVCVRAQQAPAALPNPSFESGATAPDGWMPQGQADSFTWEHGGHTGDRCISVTHSRAEQSASWRCVAALQPHQLYRFSFWSRAEDAGQGSIISGPTEVNHDFSFSPTWKRYSYVLRTPDSGSPGVRLGEWNSNAKVYFDDVQLAPLTAVEGAGSGLPLGEGEAVQDGHYTFTAPLQSGNYARPLMRASAGFNSNRWVLGGQAEVVYGQQLAGAAQRAAHLSIGIGYYAGGKLAVEASRDGQQWTPVGELGRSGTLEADLPVELFPAPAIQVRLRAAAPAAGKADSSPGSFQIDSYTYGAQLANDVPNGAGRTTFLEESLVDPMVQVHVASLGGLRPGAATTAVLRLNSTATRPGPATLRLSFTPESGPTRTFSAAARVQAGLPLDVSVPYSLEQAGAYRAQLEVDAGNHPVYRAATEFLVPSLYAADFGHPLSSSATDSVWWCEPGYKVSCDRPAPRAATGPASIAISAAGNEYEPFQLVLAPLRDLHGVMVSCGDLVGPHGARIEQKNLAVDAVAYVKVTQPSDATGVAGEWPDPLPPLTAPIDVPARRNQPFWITIYVPPGTPAGDYAGDVRLSAQGVWSRTCRLKLHVWGFSLPATTHVESALGLSPGEIRRYHNLTTNDETAEVMAKYYEDFARHRIAPYDPVYNAPITVDWGLPANAGADVAVDAAQVKLDFSRFDAAALRAFQQYRFTSWRVAVQGMGGGTFESRTKGRIGSFEAGSAQYETLFGSYLKQLQDHLEAKGWLDRAYVYWFDEPDPKDYAFVREGMERLHRYAPKLTRMLTEQPEPALEGAVDLWCPILNAYDAARAHTRQQAGERVWWYICTGPKAPYVGEFIDHAGVEPRTWLWQTWKNGVQGILIWETTYWHSETAYPKGQQNPWEDPMSWVSGYSTPAGARRPWGNGDGRFLYPPNRRGADDHQKYLTGPVDSMRWEMLREGIEDYEYLYRLRELIAARQAGGATPAQLAPFTQLLDVPPTITADLTTFSSSPQPILRQRERVAAAIEELSRQPSDRAKASLVPSPPAPPHGSRVPAAPAASRATGGRPALR